MEELVVLQDQKSRWAVTCPYCHHTTTVPPFEHPQWECPECHGIGRRPLAVKTYLTRVKGHVEHIDKHPEALTHCNGVDMAYFLPEDVRGLIAEIDRLTALCDRYRGEVAALKAEEEKTRAYWSSAYYRMEAKCEELQSALTRARAEGMEEAMMLTREYADNSRPNDEARDALVLLAQELERRVKACLLAKQANEGAADGR